MLKKEWNAESNGKLQHLFIPSKTATLVPESAVEDLPLGITAALRTGFCIERPALGQNTLMMIIDFYFSSGIGYQHTAPDIHI